MTAFLPQNDPNLNARQESILAKQSKYQYVFMYEQRLSVLKSLPFEAYPSVRWLTLVGKTLLAFLLNAIQAHDVQSNRNNALADGFDWLEQYLEYRKQTKSNDFGKWEATPNQLANHWWEGQSQVLQNIFNSFDSLPLDGNGNSLDEYDNLFQSIRLPDIRKKFQNNVISDSEFARMRVAGSNPLVIKRFEVLDEKFPITDMQYQSVMTGDSLEVAKSEGRLYLADYIALADFPGGRTSLPDNHLGPQKYLYAPLALFAVPPATAANRDLVAIAIQCGQDPAENRIITPPEDGAQQSDIWAWQIAKTIVQIADANYHELISHLGLTHLLIEPFAIATERQLASAHPLGILLRPHFEGTLAINDAAKNILIGKGQSSDKILAPGYLDSQRLSADAIQGVNFNDSFIPETFKARKVNDTNSLPNYPYRDDALLIWDAVHQWVSDYLSLYYHDDNDVKNDYELKGWLSELISSTGGQLKGIDNIAEKQYPLAYLTNITTQIIFTASAQHAAVNFSQVPMMSYAPAMPMAGYVGSNAVDNASEKKYFEMLPPIPQAQDQFQLTYLLGSVYYTKLGDYSNLIDLKIQEPLQKFQERLEEIESIIIRRNEDHPEKSYKYLIPSKIPQSINI